MSCLTGDTNCPAGSVFRLLRRKLSGETAHHPEGRCSSIRARLPVLEGHGGNCGCGDTDRASGRSDAAFFACAAHFRFGKRYQWLPEHMKERVVRGGIWVGLGFDMVLQSDTLASGDEVITSGLGGDIPARIADRVGHFY